MRLDTGTVASRTSAPPETILINSAPLSERDRAAILIDPLRDIDQYEAVARNRGCAHHARLRDSLSDIVGCPNSRV